MKKLSEPCSNCGCRRYTSCGCRLPNPKSQTQKRKKHRLELLNR
jgi:hypothetical protein